MMRFVPRHVALSYMRNDVLRTLPCGTIFVYAR